ncbi:MAG: 30S ribosomal protein S4 [Candidatus Sungbacteria bacterium]|uniref:Small ribosomal subunit protein uS4 n=1 Tax=Candidatus Sungiibacteriota bacterium TaxID=2750080 RepID=A0A932VPJ7_9BACT|nr:30S ribosomal protein S4 [Candidatus Sungbacteria bacterium]
MANVREKVERRIGEKLFLKGDRCVGPKCAGVRRAYPPGVHGKSRSRSRNRGGSEFSLLLKEKQKVHFFYGLDDRQIKRYAAEASARQGLFSDIFLRMLEGRLDSAVWRAGFFSSRRACRQAIAHGHILVNGKSARIPSRQIRIGDTITLAERSIRTGIAPAASERLKHYEPPKWIGLDKAKGVASVRGVPEADEVGMTFDLTKIREFYSR